MTKGPINLQDILRLSSKSSTPIRSLEMEYSWKNKDVSLDLDKNLTINGRVKKSPSRHPQRIPRIR